MIIKIDYRIPSDWADCHLLLRNKRLDGDADWCSQKTVLFVHGATYGATDTFDYEQEGESWMDLLATQGFDTWCLDLLGYGQSDRPAAMNELVQMNPPLTDTAFAVADLHHAVSHILAVRNIDRVHLIGYSWGTAICGSYAGQYPSQVGRLVLSGALWIEDLPPTGKPTDNLGAYRTVDVDSMMTRWAAGLDPGDIDGLVSVEERKRWCEQTASCDPTFEQTGLLRAPTGVMKDYAHCRESGEDWYDPEMIRSPVQIVVGEWDIETTPVQGQRLFARLTNAANKQITVIGRGTHSLLLENNRHLLHRVVSQFLAQG